MRKCVNYLIQCCVTSLAKGEGENFVSVPHFMYMYWKRKQKSEKRGFDRAFTKKKSATLPIVDMTTRKIVCDPNKENIKKKKKTSTKTSLNDDVLCYCTS